MRRRLVLVALPLLAAAGALVSAQTDESAFLEERETTCWPCHVAWSPPLRSMYNIIVPPEDVVIDDAPTPYPVRVQNPWLADLTYFEPSLDLSQAPSLGFAALSEPFSEVYEGTILVTPENATQGHQDIQIVPVTQGATSVRIAAEPGDTVTPVRLSMQVWTGNTSQPHDFEVVAPGAGEPVVLELGIADLRNAGAGNWTVAVRAPGVSPSDVFVGGEVPYTLNHDVRFDVSGARVQFLTSSQTVAPDGNILFRWLLVQTGEPSPGEQVVVRVNATSYYEHDASSNADDFGNFTKSLEIEVQEADGASVLMAPKGLVLPEPDVRVGVSMARVSEAVGYLASFALVLSVWTGGMFGRASRRQLNALFASAKRRVAYHNFISYALTFFAFLHLILFLIETFYHWTLGLIWGGVALLAMTGLGITGALQVPMIRRWNYGTWRWSHLLMAYAALLFTVVHLLLDGANFGVVQEWLGWSNPLDPRGVGVR